MDRRLLWGVLAWGCRGVPDLPFCSVLIEEEIREEIKPEAIVDEQGALSFDFAIPVHGLEVESLRRRWMYSEQCEDAGPPCVFPPVEYLPGRRAKPLVSGREYRARTYVWCRGAGNGIEMIESPTKFIAP